MQANTILFPTDFSACSNNALKFALNIAETFYSKLILVHVNFIFSSDHQEPSLAKKIRQQKTSDLNDLKLELLQKNPLLNITTILLDGIGPSPLMQLVQHENADIIILGAKGEGGIKNIGLGSFATEIVENALCPVLAIPEGARQVSFQKIVYASDLEHIDVAAIKELTHIATYYNSEVTILNISDQNRRFTEDQLFKFEKLVRETCSYPKLDFIYFHGTDVNHHIQEYLTRNKANLFVITTIKESLVGNLLMDKNTQKLGYHSYIPLLAFHESNKCCQYVNHLTFNPKI
jgi:nucleotide-binding universal stress UspA family protein